MSGEEGLHARAKRAGIQLAYRPAGRRGLVRASDATLLRLLETLGKAAPATRERGDADGARPRCVAPAEVLGRRAAYGIWVNLYSLRSERGFGVGNLAENPTTGNDRQRERLLAVRANLARGDVLRTRDEQAGIRVAMVGQGV